MPKGYNVLSTLNPQQQTLLSQLLGSMQGQSGNIQQQPTFQAGQSYLQKILGGDTEAFEAPVLRQFREQTIPGIAERFSGLGSGAQSSSAFQQALGGAGADLGERLGALRGGLQMQALPRALDFAQQPVSNLQNLLGLQTQAMMPKQRPFWQEALLGVSPGVGGALGGGLGSGIGGLSTGISSVLQKILRALGG